MPAHLKILVVDDNPPALKATARILAQAGYEVTLAVDGMEALAQVRETRPSLVLLDVVLPDISGNEVLRQIRSDPSLASIAVVMISSRQTLSEQQAECLNAGADDYIARPIANSELLARVRSQFRQRALMEQLRASEQQFHSAFDYASIGMALVAPDGRYLKVNRALCQMLGYSEAELLDRSYLDITHPEDRDELGEDRRRLLEGEIETFQMEKRYVHRQGHLVWTHLSLSLARDAEGKPLHLISQVQDITGRFQAQDAIRMQSLMLDQIGQAVIVTETRGSVIYANRFARELYGWTREEMLGKDILDVVVPQVSQKQTREITLHLQRLQNWSGELLVRNHDGHMFPAHITISPMLDPHRRGVGLICVSSDVSERKLAEEEIRASEERLRIVTGTAATRSPTRLTPKFSGSRRRTSAANTWPTCSPRFMKDRSARTLTARSPESVFPTSWKSRPKAARTTMRSNTSR